MESNAAHVWESGVPVGTLSRKRPKPTGWWLIVAIVFVVAITGVGFVLWQQSQQQQAADSEEGLAIEVDMRVLEVEVVKPIRSVLNPVTEVTIVSNKEVTMEPHGRAELVKIENSDSPEHYYVLRVTKLPIGESKVNIKLKDEAGNDFSQEIIVTRESFGFPVGYDNGVGAWPDAQYSVDGSSYAVVVDKQHRLLEDYEPDDLVDLNADLGLYTLNNAVLRAEPARALRSMLNELATATGKYVTIASGYRSYETQVKTYSGWVKELGEIGADQVSARPGHSEHQLGTAVDFVSDETNWQITNDFGATVAGKWLAENCTRFGFILPYQQDQTADGGYKEESWHFRYIGIE